MCAKMMKGEELHLKIGTLHYPPFIFHEEDRVYGIEPSLLHILAAKLNFTFEYAFAAPNEMWGAIVDFGGNNVSITGLVGMLHRGEVDVTLGNLYLDYNRKKYIDFTQPYGISNECFMVPVPLPYPKWTALYEPFEWSVWTALLLSVTFAALTLRFAAKLQNVASTFNDIFLCILFFLGHVLGMNQNHQGIHSATSRFLFIIWLLCTFVIATIYRSELISYMTSPYTPPPVDTIKQLVDSSLSKIAYGTFVRDILLSSDIRLLKQLGQQMIVTRNFTYLFSLMKTGLWATDSSKESLQYQVGVHFKGANIRDRMHLMSECVLPGLNAFGLKKDSHLRPAFNYELQRLLESGLIEYHRSEFAKKSTKNGNQASKTAALVDPLSLNDLQGAFYLLIVGLLFSLLCFVIERVTQSLNKIRVDYKKKTNNIEE